MHLLAPVVLLSLLAYGSTVPRSSDSKALSKAYKSLYAFGKKYESAWFDKIDRPSAAFSPLSIWLSLSLLYEGSGGSTETALKSALEAGRKDDHIEAAKALKKELSNLFEADRKDYNGVVISNALLIAKDITIKPEFLEVARNFPAYTPRVTFPDDPLILRWLQKIGAGNEWFRSRPDADAKLVVASGLKLRGEVLANTRNSNPQKFIPRKCEQFFPQNQEVIPRHGGEKLQVQRKIPYQNYELYANSGAVLAENDQYKVLSLPFHKTNKKLQLHIVMAQAPAADFPPPSPPGADYIDIEEAVKSAKNVNYDLLKVKIPRITYADRISVDEILKDDALGLSVMYSKTDANFEQISDGILSVSHIQSYTDSWFANGAYQLNAYSKSNQKESPFRASYSNAYMFVEEEFIANRPLQYMVALHDSGHIIPIVKGIYREEEVSC